jgi:hypothetical protein
MLKKEQQRQADQSQFTYQPTIFTKRPSSAQQRPAKSTESSRDQENRFEKLYVDAVKRQITEKIVQQVANDVRNDKDLTFTPKLSKRGASESRSASRERLGISRSSSFSDGYSSAASIGSQRTRSRSNSPARSECSFTPKITKLARETAGRRSTDVDSVYGDEPLSSRLYRQAAVLQEKAALKRDEFAQLSMQECTFAPQLATTRSPRPTADEAGLDVTDRLHLRELQRRARLEQLKAERAEKERELLTFRPQIKETKRSSSASRDRPQDVVDRLLAPCSPSRNSLIAAEEASAELTFQPQLASRRSASPSLQNGEFSTVHERLFEMGVHRLRERDTEVRSLLLRAPSRRRLRRRRRRRRHQRHRH